MKSLTKRLDTIKARLKPEPLIIVRTKTMEEGKHLVAEAKRNGERLITIQRSYGMSPVVLSGENAL